MIADSNTVLRTGDEARHAPAGWRVFFDTSWDQRGSTVAARKEDITVLSEGSASTLSRVQVRAGAEYFVGEDAFAVLERRG